MTIKQKNKQIGMTIMEIMVASTVGLIVSLAATTLLVQNKQSYSQNDQISFLQDNGRYAVNTLIQDLSAVDYWGGLTSPEVITSADPDLAISGTECTATAGDAYDAAASLSYVFAPSAAELAATFPCISAIDANTDVLMIKRVRGLAATTLEDGEVYLRTNRTKGEFFVHDGGAAAPAAAETDWLYYMHVYYVEGDMLKRKKLRKDSGSGDPAMDTETLAEGIEQFHVMYGIDADGDDSADYYDSNVSNAELESAVSAKIFVLARADATVTGYTNEKTYQLGDISRGPFNDGYYRRVFSASVPLRNLISTRQFN